MWCYNYSNKERLEFIKHLTNAYLFNTVKYPDYYKTFSVKYFQCSINYYPFFDKERLG